MEAVSRVAVLDRGYYRPTGRGNERAVSERAAALRKIVRGESS